MAARPLLVAALACVLLLTAGAPVRAQNSPQDYLQAHNAARAAVGVGPMTWSPTLAAYAANYAGRLTDCSLVHSDGPYGENLFGGTGDWTAREAVEDWVSERRYYDYPTKTCATGQDCGHYTQVVWRNSVQLGCARLRCTSENAILIICSYSPRGNIIGEWPY